MNSADTSTSDFVIPGSASCTIQATAEQVRDALEQITSGLPEPSLEDDPTARLEIVLAEVLNNIVEHAYGLSGEGQIDINVEWDEAGIHCQTVDAGKEMPGLVVPQGSLPDSDVETEALPEGGFGWFMIHTLAQDLVYKREADANRLSFRIDWTSDVE